MPECFRFSVNVAREKRHTSFFECIKFVFDVKKLTLKTLKYFSE